MKGPWVEGPFIMPGCRSGGQGRDRTADPAIFSRMLYQLSYLAMLSC